MHPARASDRPRRRPLPEQVRHLTSLHLELVDEELPGLVEGLYLHGSLAFGEWYDGRSDIDFVAVTAERPDVATVATLRDVHDRMVETFPRPPYDGCYVTWADLARPPADCPDVPCTLAGAWHDAGRVSVDPVTWHELSRCGVVVRGPRPEQVELWADRQALRAFTHENLTSYWSRELEALAAEPEAAADPEVVAWFVLGTSRLHHLLATDELTSKDGAGRHAVEAFGEEWRLLVVEALTFRALGEPLGALTGPALAEQVLAFSSMVVRAGLDIPV